MGLKDLAKKDVENIFSYVLSKYPSVNDFLMNFDTILKKLYEHKDYTGGWDQKKVDGLLREYEKRTDAIKKDYKDKKIVHLTGSSMTIIGGILSFTPIAPVGWGLLGAGGAMNSITDVVDLADKSKQKAWERAKNNLQDYVENPFANTTFKDVYDELMRTFNLVKDKISNEDYTVILQGLGWNYFLFRSQNKSHEESIGMLTDVLELFRTHRYTISTELKTENINAIEEIKYDIEKSCNSILMAAGALGLIGFSAGLSIGALIAGYNIAGAAFRGAETIAHCLLSIGNFAMRNLNFPMKAGPAIAIVGGICSIALDATALKNIDKTFQKYYDYKTECEKIINQYKVDYEKTNDAICGMYKFLTEDRSQKVED